MTSYHNLIRMGKLLTYGIIGILFLIQQAHAQFTVNESLKGSTVSGIIYGDNAKLTSGNTDPEGQGWLRVTADGLNQKGFAYVNTAFPTSLGVLVDFEYKMWRSQTGTSLGGGDGMSVFLFDGRYGPTGANIFKLGGYGGSLGYANYNKEGVVAASLTGGYIGLGLDAYGNYSAPTEGRVGGSGYTPNAIVLRGGTTSDLTTTNKWLFTKALGDRTGGNTAILGRNEIDYNTITTTRPSDAVFFRRVQIEIKKVGIQYNIAVRWKKQGEANFTELISYNTTEAPPATLKLGFAASTGAAVNNHEVRNLFATTPGGIRVTKQANKGVLKTVPGVRKENEITYTIEVKNDTPAPLGSITLDDKLTDGNGNAIPSGMFRITNISTTGFSNQNLPTPTVASPITAGAFNATVGLPANGTGLVTVTGILKNRPTGNLLRNTVTVNCAAITEADLLNNTAMTQVPVKINPAVSNPMLPSKAN